MAFHCQPQRSHVRGAPHNDKLNQRELYFSLNVPPAPPSIHADSNDYLGWGSSQGASWSSWDDCDESPGFVNGFKLRVEAPGGGTNDNTGLNSIKGFCSNVWDSQGSCFAEQRTTTGFIVSDSGLEQCEWGRITQCPSGCVRGYRIRLFPDGGRSSDRTGAEGFSFKCTDGTTCSLENSNSQGEWSSWAYWVLISQSA